MHTILSIALLVGALTPYPLAPLSASAPVSFEAVRASRGLLQQAVEPHVIRAGEPGEGILADADPRLDDDSPYVEWVFSADAGQRFQVDLTSEEFDTYLTLGRSVSGAFVELVSNDDAPTREVRSTNSRVSYTAESGGDFLLRVSAYQGSGLGPYSLLVTPLPPARTEPRGGILSLGGAVEGVMTMDEALIRDEVPYQQWTIRVQLPERIAVELLSGDFDTQLTAGRMDDGVFQEIAYNDDWPGHDNPSDSRLVLTVREPGDYLLRVNPYFPDETGSYRLTATVLPALPEEPVTRTVQPGEDVSGILGEEDAQLEDNSPYHHWTFSARADQRFEIVLASDEFDTVVVVGASLNDIFEEIASNDDWEDSSDSRLEFVAPTDGTYTIRVRPFSSEGRGEYRLSVRPAD